MFCLQPIMMLDRSISKDTQGGTLFNTCQSQDWYTVEPLNKDTLGAATLSFIQRLSFVRRLKMLQL